MSQPGAVEMNDEFRAQLIQLQVVVIEARLMLEALKGRADLEPASLGAQLVELLLPICEARVKPMTIDAAPLVRRRAASSRGMNRARAVSPRGAAAWDGKGDDFDSLQFIPDVLCIMATKLELVKKGRRRWKAVTAARPRSTCAEAPCYVLDGAADAGADDVERCYGDTDENSQVSMEVEFFQEERLAVAAKAAKKRATCARWRSPTRAEPNQPFGIRASD